MKDEKYRLTIKMNSGEKIETIVSKSIITYLQVTHANYNNYKNINCLIEIDGREIKVEDVDYFMWSAIVEDKHI